MKTIQLFILTLILFCSINVLSAQQTNTIDCDNAKNKIEELYIVLHKVYTSKTVNLAKKDIYTATKVLNLAKKEIKKCPCQLAENLTSELIITLKNYKKLNSLDDMHAMAKTAMFQSRDIILELRQDKLAQF